MIHNLVKLCESLDQKQKYQTADSITEYLLNLAKSKTLKKQSFKKDLPSKLLLLEKAGVDTSKYYNALLDDKITEEDLKDIEQKFKVNCDKKPIKSENSLSEYIEWMNDKKDTPIKQNENADKYLNEIRESFIDFLTDVVMKDFKKENEQITPRNLIDFYFQNREKYENALDSYQLMVGQTEGIISDKNFVDELSEEFDYDDSMIRRGK